MDTQYTLCSEPCKHHRAHAKDGSSKKDVNTSITRYNNMQLTLFKMDTHPLPKKIIEPPKKFQIIYADPPWTYGTSTFFNGQQNKTGNASDHYPTMDTEDIAMMNVNEIAEEDSLLYMWTTGPYMEKSIMVMNRWGFQYITMAFVWHKGKPNPGYYSMSSCEYVILGKKGRIPQPRGERNIRQFVSKKKTKHSEKPHEVRRRIEQMHPTQTKLEMFARTSKEGWFVWGNQAPNSINIPKLKKII